MHEGEEQAAAQAEQAVRIHPQHLSQLSRADLALATTGGSTEEEGWSVRP